MSRKLREREKGGREGVCVCMCVCVCVCVCKAPTNQASSLEKAGLLFECICSNFI